jgi:hypothetical protein
VNEWRDSLKGKAQPGFELSHSIYILWLVAKDKKLKLAQWSVSISCPISHNHPLVPKLIVIILESYDSRFGCVRSRVQIPVEPRFFSSMMNESLPRPSLGIVISDFCLILVVYVKIFKIAEEIWPRSTVLLPGRAAKATSSSSRKLRSCPYQSGVVSTIAAARVQCMLPRDNYSKPSRAFQV